MAFSGDVVPVNPMVGVYGALTRTGRVTGRVFGPDERITMPEIIRGYTLAGAYFVHAETKLGSIEPGKYADLIILSDDPMEIDPEDVLEMYVETTIVSGKIVYQAPLTNTEYGNEVPL